jgi:hypothetical protein
MAGVLHEIAVRGLFADVVLLVVAMALGGVEWNGRRAAGPLVTLRLLRNGLDGLVQRLCHRWSPLFARSNAGHARPFLKEPSAFFAPDNSQKAAARFARRVKLASKKYLPLRIAEIMI